MYKEVIVKMKLNKEQRKFIKEQEKLVRKHYKREWLNIETKIMLCWIFNPINVIVVSMAVVVCFLIVNL